MGSSANRSKICRPLTTLKFSLAATSDRSLIYPSNTISPFTRASPSTCSSACGAWVPMPTFPSVLMTRLSDSAPANTCKGFLSVVPSFKKKPDAEPDTFQAYVPLSKRMVGAESRSKICKLVSGNHVPKPIFPVFLIVKLLEGALG